MKLIKKVVSRTPREKAVSELLTIIAECGNQRGEGYHVIKTLAESAISHLKP